MPFQANTTNKSVVLAQFYVVYSFCVQLVAELESLSCGFLVSRDLMFHADAILNQWPTQVAAQTF